LRLVYGRADGMPNSPQSMVVCGKNYPNSAYIEQVCLVF
jgi:hypothetical protein